MAHYASNLDTSPATAPTIAPPNTSTHLPQQHGSHLALPDLRSTSPLPPIGHISQGGIPQEIELASETQSVSSLADVTYNYPISGTSNSNTNPFRNPFTQSPPQLPARPTPSTTLDLAPVITSPSIETGEMDETQLHRPAWAEEGLGSNELSTLSLPATPAPAGGGTNAEKRPESPLPPGAAPAAHAEPERSGTL